MKAMIFAAGLGTRFKPWTDTNPKALAVINGKSLLQRNIEYLQQAGIEEVVVNVHHFSDQIKAAVKQHEGWGSHVVISDESDKLLDTGGGLMKARRHLQDDVFITINADILTDLDLRVLMDHHKRSDALITVAISDRKTSRYLLFDQFDRMCGWRNTTTQEERIVLPVENIHEMAFNCVSVFQPQVFELVRQSGKFSLTELFLELAEGNLILGFNHSGGKFIDVGKPESVKTAERLFP